MKPWRLEWRQSTRRQLRELPAGLRREIVALLLLLQEDPYPPEAEPMKRDLTGVYRIRVDGWRIIYQVREDDKIVIIRGIRRRDASTYLNL